MEAHHALVDFVDNAEGRDGDARQRDQVHHGAHAALAAALPLLVEHVQVLALPEAHPAVRSRATPVGYTAYTSDCEDMIAYTWHAL